VPETTPPPPIASSHSPDYVELVRFLVQPFLESPDSLRIDCEVSPRTSRVLIRLAFDGEDKGRVFGRGGRNIQAIRTVLQAIAQSAGQVAHLEVFGSSPDRESRDGRDDGRERQREGQRDGSQGERPRSQSHRPPQRRPR
jgi:uncharacterized protein